MKYECAGQMSIFDMPQKAKLVRKNEYESYRCTNCGAICSPRKLIGDWPYEYVVTEECPNCKAVIDVSPEIRREAELNKKSKNHHDVVANDLRDGWAEPKSCEDCDVKFGSLICFERRGYFYLRSQRKWLRGSDGKPKISQSNIVCHKKFGEPSDACIYSGHECNKQELWKVADALDETSCPHTCCRLCSDKLCGARCNGS